MIEIGATAIETVVIDVIATEDSAETAIISGMIKIKIRKSPKRTNLSVVAPCLAILGTPVMNRIHFKARTCRWKTSTWTSTMRTVKTCLMKTEAADFKPEGETPVEALGATMRDGIVATNRKETLTIATTEGTNVRDDRPAIREGAESPERV